MPSMVENLHNLGLYLPPDPAIRYLSFRHVYLLNLVLSYDPLQDSPNEAPNILLLGPS